MKLSVRSLSKSYAAPGGKIIHALRDCSFDIDIGSFTVIAGRSGCGKTTLLKIMAGLEKADSGTVEYGKYDEQTVPLKTGFMFQDPRLLPWLTIEQNCALAFPHTKDKNEKKSIHNTILKTLEMAGIADRALSLPHELSGGMAQRAALARCLCRDPALLLLDEPLSSLDAFTRHRLREELEKLWKMLGITIILVTHDSEDAVFFGKSVLLLDNGAIESEIPIPLPRPRDCRTAEFQEYCKKIEDAVCKK